MTEHELINFIEATAIEVGRTITGSTEGAFEEANSDEAGE
jgi:hypothetical protein